MRRAALLLVAIVVLCSPVVLAAPSGSPTFIGKLYSASADDQISAETATTDDEAPLAESPLPASGHEATLTEATDDSLVSSGNLIVSVSARNMADKPLTATQLAQSFALIINFADEQAHTYSIDDQLPETLQSSGVIYLHPGQKATFQNLPYKTMYTITQAPVYGYRLQSHNHQGNIVSPETRADFENTYIAESGSLTINYPDGLPDLPTSEAYPETDEPGFLPMNTEGSASAIAATVYRESRKAVDKNEDSGLSDFLNITVRFYNIPTSEAIVYADGQPFVITADASQIDLRLYCGEQIVLGNLPAGIGYDISATRMQDQTEMVFPHGYRGHIVAGSQNLSFVGAGDAGEAAPTDTPAPTGSLCVSQAIFSQLGMPTGAQYLQSFAFVVTFDNLGDQRISVVSGDSGYCDTVSAESPSIGFVLAHGQSRTFSELPAGVGYTVKVLPQAGYQATVDEVNGVILAKCQAQASFSSLVSFYTELPMTTLTVTNQLTGISAGERADSSFEYVLKVDSDDPVYFSLAASESRTFYGLLPDMNYTIQETNPYAGGYLLTEAVNGSATLVADASCNKASFTHQPDYRQIINIAGQINWETEGFDIELPETVTVMLLNESSVLQRATVCADENGNWTYSFQVPRYNAAKERIVYRLEESEVSGFHCQIVNTTITNHITSDKRVTLTGWLTWDQQGQNEPLPKQVVVYLMDGQKMVDFAAVTPNSSGLWAYSFTADTYDNQQKRIDYHIEQSAVAGYDTQVNGNCITNTRALAVLPNEMPALTNPWLPRSGDPVGLAGSMMSIELLACGLVILAVRRRCCQMVQMRRSFRSYGNWSLGLGGEKQFDDTFWQDELGDFRIN